MKEQTVFLFHFVALCVYKKCMYSMLPPVQLKVNLSSLFCRYFPATHSVPFVPCHSGGHSPIGRQFLQAI